jgi:hypothetical protein
MLVGKPDRANAARLRMGLGDRILPQRGMGLARRAGPDEFLKFR